MPYHCRAWQTGPNPLLGDGRRWQAPFSDLACAPPSEIPAMVRGCERNPISVMLKGELDGNSEPPWGLEIHRQADEDVELRRGIEGLFDNGKSTQNAVLGILGVGQIVEINI